LPGLTGFPATADFASIAAFPGGTPFAPAIGFADGAGFAARTDFAVFMGGFAAAGFFAATRAAGFRFAACFGAGFERDLAGFDFGRALRLREVAIG
jgi:hypothetical protein